MPDPSFNPGQGRFWGISIDILAVIRWIKKYLRRKKDEKD